MTTRNNTGIGQKCLQVLFFVLDLDLHLDLTVAGLVTSLRTSKASQPPPRVVRLV